MSTTVKKYSGEIFPQKAYDLFRKEPYCAILDSSLESENGKYSIIGIHPFYVLKEQDGKTYANDRVIERDFEDALRQSLRQAGARNEKAVRALLKEQELALGEDGTLQGLDEQLEALRHECGYLFGPNQAPPNIIRPGNRVSKEADDGKVREIMGLPSFVQGKDDF